MKVVATTLALAIGIVGVIFLSILTWHQVIEEPEPTWAEYQACTELLAIETLHKTPYGRLLEARRRGDAAVDDLEDEMEILASFACAELRPILITDE